MYVCLSVPDAELKRWTGLLLSCPVYSTCYSFKPRLNRNVITIPLFHFTTIDFKNRQMILKNNNNNSVPHKTNIFNSKMWVKRLCMRCIQRSVDPYWDLQNEKGLTEGHQIVFRPSDGVQAFRWCSGLQMVFRPSDGVQVFRWCSGPQMVFRPSDGVQAFRRCSGLQTVFRPSGPHSLALAVKKLMMACMHSSESQRSTSRSTSWSLTEWRRSLSAARISCLERARDWGIERGTDEEKAEISGWRQNRLWEMQVRNIKCASLLLVLTF